MEGQKLTTRTSLLTSEQTDIVHVVRDGKSYQTQVKNLNPIENIANNVLGGVVYLGGMNYYVWASQYTINSTIYNTFVSDTVTLDDGGALDGRLDIFAVEINQIISTSPAVPSIVVIKGVEAANPVLPSLDLETQAKVSFVLVNANDTSNNDIDIELIYDENVGVAGGEWNNTINSTGGNLNYTIDPYNGVNSFLRPINISSPSVVTWVNDSLSSYNVDSKLIFAYKGKLLSNSKINFKFINSSNQSYFLNTITAANINSRGYSDFVLGWQILNINFADFISNTANNTGYDTLEITFTNTPEIDIDRVFIQTGIDGVPPTGTTTWGTIEGSISNQTDLQDALNEKKSNDLLVVSNISGATDLDWSKDVHKLTATSDITFSDINLPSHPKTITIYLTGEFIITPVSNWDLDLTFYDGTVYNRITIDYVESGFYSSDLKALL